MLSRAKTTLPITSTKKTSIWEKKTGNKPAIKNYSELSPKDRKSNLIVLGTSGSNKMLKEVYEMTNATVVNETYPGENKGLLEITKNPWDIERNMLLIEGSFEVGVQNIVNKLMSEGLPKKDLFISPEMVKVTGILSSYPHPTKPPKPPERRLEPKVMYIPSEQEQHRLVELMAILYVTDVSQGQTIQENTTVLLKFKVKSLPSPKNVSYPTKGDLVKLEGKYFPDKKLINSKKPSSFNVSNLKIVEKVEEVPEPPVVGKEGESILIKKI